MHPPCWKRREKDVPRGELERQTNVPARKSGATLAQVPGAPVYLTSIRTYLARLGEHIVEGRGLLLWGPYRSGKSSLAACVLREVYRHRCPAFWIEAFELVDLWRAEGADDERRDEFRGSPFVVVDDIGTEGSQEWRKEVLVQALRFRLERAGATIVTTNLPLDGLQQIYGAKFMALLQECLMPIHVEGVNWNARTA